MSEGEREAILAIIKEIDINRRVCADHCFSGEEATTIQNALRLAARPASNEVRERGMDRVDAEYYAGGLRELAQDMTNAPDKSEVEYLMAAAAFIERLAAEPGGSK